MISEHALLPIRQVTQFTSLSRSSIYRQVAAGSFPPPIRISTGRVAWRLEDIKDWTRSRPSTPASVRRRGFGVRAGDRPAPRGAEQP